MGRSELILIGPIGAGKSTLAKLIADKTGLPQCSMDEFRWKYYTEIGYNSEHAKELGEQSGFRAVYDYWKPFEAHAVQRLLAEHPNCVIDFGAGHSVYEDPKLFECIREIMAPFQNVVLVLPSPDEDESIEVLASRAPAAAQDFHELNEHFVRHHSNRSLAKHVIFTNGKSARDSAEELIQLTNLMPL